MRKHLVEKLKQSKKGMTSLYVVVFASILFGVITLSFIRIVLSEASQSSNDDLSRSAYDAAMAGVEDAKTAVTKYYNCLNGDGQTPATCDYSVLFRDRCDSAQGIGLAQYLYSSNYTDGEVLIQQNNVGSSVDNSSDQAYTCVIISDKVQDYRGTLTSDTRTKVVPLRIYDGENAAGDTIKKVGFGWYSSLNEGSTSGDPNRFVTASGAPSPSLGDNDHKTTPPTIQLTYIKVSGSSMDVSDFHKVNNAGNLEYSTMVIVPNGSGGTPLLISDTERSAAGNVTGGSHATFGISCSTTSPDFACNLELNDTNIGSTDTAFLVVSLPYKETVSDFGVTLYNSSDEVITFDGVQISVDSTGRTNQLVRRVETRLDPADLFFPYPQYALELTGQDGENVLEKNFWITANCWYSQYNIDATQCPNNGEVN